MEETSRIRKVQAGRLGGGLDLESSEEQGARGVCVGGCLSPEGKLGERPS